MISNDFALGASTGAVIFTGTGNLKSISNNVTLGALRTVTVSNTFTGNFGTYDAYGFNVAALLPGPDRSPRRLQLHPRLDAFSNDTNNYIGDFSVSSGNTRIHVGTDQRTPSSLGVGATGTGGRITLDNRSSAGTLRYVGADNSATHRP